MENTTNIAYNNASQTKLKTTAVELTNPGSSQRPSEKNCTLIIGSSILQRISTRGLRRNVRVRTMYGAQVSDVRQRLETTDLTDVQNVILQVGGNDLNNKRNTEAIENDFAEIINDLRHRSPNINVYISEVPRIDVERRDLLELNSIIKGVCEMYGATFIPSTNVISKVSARNYWFDHLHLSDFGTVKLLKICSEFVPVIKAKEAKVRALTVAKMDTTQSDVIIEGNYSVMPVMNSDIKRNSVHTRMLTTN